MTDEVREALRRLATETTLDPADTVDEAVSALDDVCALAAFVEDGGPDRLDRAIDRAARAGDTATARRGRRALGTIERCRDVAADHFHSGRGTVLSAGDQPPTR
ncbi:hypothetical protein ACFR97_10850 [Haloplanus litoreus]|uniref:Uncharacterized protein n=1 Tax=Haloplanus litoreus TaxID=767515 RepID=A0ABD6A1G4_9EURY